MRYFTRAISDINNVMGYIRLFCGDSKDDQIQSLMQYASSVTNGNKEATSIIMEGIMLPRFTVVEPAKNSP